MQSVELLSDFTEGLLSMEDLGWMLSDAEASGCKQVLITFTTDSNIIPQVNLIFSYTAEVGLVEWLRIEILISKDIDATAFFTKQYPELIESKGEVVVRSDGISVFYRVSTQPETRKLRDYVKTVAEIVGANVTVLKYASYTLVPEEHL